MIIKDYPKIEYYNKNNYPTKKDILNESVADYFVKFMMNNKNFSVKYPCLWIYFNNILNKLI